MGEAKTSATRKYRDFISDSMYPTRVPVVKKSKVPTKTKKSTAGLGGKGRPKSPSLDIPEQAGRGIGASKSRPKIKTPIVPKSPKRNKGKQGKQGKRVLNMPKPGCASSCALKGNKPKGILKVPKPNLQTPVSVVVEDEIRAKEEAQRLAEQNRDPIEPEEQEQEDRRSVTVVEVDDDEYIEGDKDYVFIFDPIRVSFGEDPTDIKDFPDGEWEGESIDNDTIANMFNLEIRKEIYRLNELQEAIQDFRDAAHKAGYGYREYIRYAESNKYKGTVEVTIDSDVVTTASGPGVGKLINGIRLEGYNESLARCIDVLDINIEHRKHPRVLLYLSRGEYMASVFIWELGDRLVAYNMHTRVDITLLAFNKEEIDIIEVIVGSLSVYADERNINKITFAYTPSGIIGMGRGSGHNRFQLGFKLDESVKSSIFTGTAIEDAPREKNHEKCYDCDTLKSDKYTDLPDYVNYIDF